MAALGLQPNVGIEDTLIAQQFMNYAREIATALWGRAAKGRTSAPQAATPNSVAAAGNFLFAAFNCN